MCQAVRVSVLIVPRAFEHEVLLSMLIGRGTSVEEVAQDTTLPFSWSDSELNISCTVATVHTDVPRAYNMSAFIQNFRSRVPQKFREITCPSFMGHTSQPFVNRTKWGENLPGPKAQLLGWIAMNS